jgi:hypothetical protein
LAAVLNSLGVVAYFEGDQPTSRRFYEESLNIARALGDIQGVNTAVQNVAELQFADGDAAAAIETARQGVSAAREADDREGECWISTNLGAYLLLQDDVEEGTAVTAFGLKQALDLEIEYAATCALQHLALAKAQSGFFSTAARLQGHVDATYMAIGAKRDSTEQTSSDRLMAKLIVKLTEADLVKLLAEGAALDRDSAVVLALRESAA